MYYCCEDSVASLPNSSAENTITNRQRVICFRKKECSLFIESVYEMKLPQVHDGFLSIILYNKEIMDLLKWDCAVQIACNSSPECKV